MSSKLDQQIFTGEDYVLVWVESFLKERTAQNLTKGSIKFYREKLKGFVDYLDTQEVKYISQITPNTIRDFLLILEDRGHNPGGIHTFFRCIKAFLKFYWDEVEPPTKNPIDKVKAPRVPIEPIEGISLEDFDLLLEACARGRFTGERDRAILFTLLDTGVRASELCNINSEDLNLADSSILIRQGKGRKPRFVFFGKKTRKQIRKYLTLRGTEDNALFITRDRERLNYLSLREIVRRLSLKAGIKEPGLHDFRRAFCLACLKKGMNEISISRIMGHTTTQLIGRYAKQTAIDLMNSYKSPLDD
jgi:integrase/recombinase XerD